MQPPGQGAGPGQPPGRANEEEEGGLEGVIRARLAQDVAAGTEDERAVAADEFGEGRLVARGYIALEKFGVGRRRDHRSGRRPGPGGEGARRWARVEPP